jgi:hypothetical protein
LVQTINSGNVKNLESDFITFQEYDKLIHPYLPEAKQNNPISSEDKWKYFITPARAKAIAHLADLMNEGPLSYASTLPAVELLKFNPVIIHKKIPIVFIDKKGNHLTRSDIIGVVIELNGKYKLLHIAGE